MRKGFTLVELSIVLVVIGLLIGGILAANSMLSTAKINKFVGQIQHFDIALRNFQNKYKQLPGDGNRLPGVNGYFGNNNGILEDYRSVYAWGGYYGHSGGGSEIDTFWKQLQMSGFNYQNKTFADVVTLPKKFDIDSQNPNSPKVSLDIDAGVVAMTCNAMSLALPCWSIGDFRGKGDAFGPDSGLVQVDGVHPALKPSTMYAIDAKMDDKRANSGNVQPMSGSGTCFSGADYITTTNSVVCNTFIRALSQSGPGN